MQITQEQREAWEQNTKNSPFNQRLDKRVRNADGSLDLEKLYQVSHKHGIDKEYEHLNAGQQRMIIGNLLRPRVKI